MPELAGCCATARVMGANLNALCMDARWASRVPSLCFVCGLGVARVGSALHVVCRFQPRPVSKYDRVRTVKTTYDDYGMADTVEDQGDDAVKDDEKCTRTWYARNDDKGLNSLVSRTRTVAKTCATADSALDLPADSSRPGNVISDTATIYDDTAATVWSASQKPTKGDAVWTGRAKGYGSDDTPAWQKTATSSYDTLGRVRVVKDAGDRLVADTTYVPVDAGPLTSTSASNFKGYTTTSAVDFATGATVKSTDPNNKVTESEYDSLGRVTKAWLPNRLTVLKKTPNYVYDYKITSSAMSWVSTSALKGDGSGYNTSYTFYDSLLRTRQTQSRPRRVVGLSPWPCTTREGWPSPSSPTSGTAPRRRRPRRWKPPRARPRSRRTRPMTAPSVRSRR